MACGHAGFHSITSRYDRHDGTLIYLRMCDRCGAVVAEVERLIYRPRFEAAPQRGFDIPEMEYGPAATSLWRATSDEGGGPGGRDRWSDARNVTNLDAGDGRVRCEGVH
jgi:hypothetical protein